MDPLFVKFDLTRILCTDEGDGPGNAEPYLWTVFFKIDGDTVTVDKNFMLQGTATVVRTIGNHGDLGVAEVAAGDTVAIPPALGHFETVLKPIPFSSVPGKTVGGVIGCVVVLMEEDSTPADVIAQGHGALNTGLQNALNGLISTLGISKQAPTSADLDKLQSDVADAVTSAIADHVSFWNEVWTLTTFGNGQDDKIGAGKTFFTHSQLDSAAGSPIPLHWHWINEGEWAIDGQVVVSKRVHDAIWRPGDAAEVQFYGMKLADYQKQYDDLWKKNYRIHLLNTYEENGQRLYDATWRPGTTGEMQAYGQTQAAFQARYDDLWKKGYRIQLLNTYEENGQRLYDAVWRPATTGEVQFYGMKLADYQKQYDDLWKKNYRIYLLNTYEENGQRLYDAVWRPGTAGEIQFYGLKRTDFQKKYDDLWKQDYRLYLLNTYIENSQILYDAVWRPSQDGETQFYGLSSSDYQAHYDELWKKGLRVEILNTYEVGA